MNFLKRVFNPSEEAEETRKEGETPAAEPKTEPSIEAEKPAEPAPQPASTSEEPTIELAKVKPEEEEPPTVKTDDGSTRRLEAEKLISAVNMHVIFGQATDVGPFREKNEDSLFAVFSTSQSTNNFPDFGIFVIADGMGGHAEGDKASAIAVKVVASELFNSVFVPIISGDDIANMSPMAELLISAVEKANREVHVSIPKGGGTTCTAVMILRERAYIAHVGDSRAYMITQDGIEQLTHDHSVVQRLIDLGTITEEEGRVHPRANELYRTLGFNDSIEVDVFSRRLVSGSKLIICTDGLWNVVKKETMLDIVQKHNNPQDAANKLIAKSNENGTTDNISVIVVYR